MAALNPQLANDWRTQLKAGERTGFITRLFHLTSRIAGPGAKDTQNLQEAAIMYEGQVYRQATNKIHYFQMLTQKLVQLQSHGAASQAQSLPAQGQNNLLSTPQQQIQLQRLQQLQQQQALAASNANLAFRNLQQTQAQAQAQLQLQQQVKAAQQTQHVPQASTQQQVRSLSSPSPGPQTQLNLNVQALRKLPPAQQQMLLLQQQQAQARQTQLQSIQGNQLSGQTQNQNAQISAQHQAQAQSMQTQQALQATQMRLHQGNIQQQQARAQQTQSSLQSASISQKQNAIPRQNLQLGVNPSGGSQNLVANSTARLQQQQQTAATKLAASNTAMNLLQMASRPGAQFNPQQVQAILALGQQQQQQQLVARQLQQQHQQGQPQVAQIQALSQAQQSSRIQGQLGSQSQPQSQVAQQRVTNGLMAQRTRTPSASPAPPTSRLPLQNAYNNASPTIAQSQGQQVQGNLQIGSNMSAPQQTPHQGQAQASVLGQAKGVQPQTQNAQQRSQQLQSAQLSAQKDVELTQTQTQAVQPQTSQQLQTAQGQLNRVAGDMPKLSARENVSDQERRQIGSQLSRVSPVFQLLDKIWPTYTELGKDPQGRKRMLFLRKLYKLQVDEFTSNKFYITVDGILFMAQECFRILRDFVLESKQRPGLTPTQSRSMEIAEAGLGWIQPHLFQNGTIGSRQTIPNPQAPQKAQNQALGNAVQQLSTIGVATPQVAQQQAAAIARTPSQQLMTNQLDQHLTAQILNDSSAGFQSLAERNDRGSLQRIASQLQHTSQQVTAPSTVPQSAALSGQSNLYPSTGPPITLGVTGSGGVEPNDDEQKAQAQSILQVPQLQQLSQQQSWLQLRQSEQKQQAQHLQEQLLRLQKEAGAQQATATNISGPMSLPNVPTPTLSHTSVPANVSSSPQVLATASMNGIKGPLSLSSTGVASTSSHNASTSAARSTGILAGSPMGILTTAPQLSENGGTNQKHYHQVTTAPGDVNGSGLKPMEMPKGHAPLHTAADDQMAIPQQTPATEDPTPPVKGVNERHEELNSVAHGKHMEVAQLATSQGATAKTLAIENDSKPLDARQRLRKILFDAGIQPPPGRLPNQSMNPFVFCKQQLLYMSNLEKVFQKQRPPSTEPGLQGHHDNSTLPKQSPKIASAKYLPELMSSFRKILLHRQGVTVYRTLFSRHARARRSPRKRHSDRISGRKRKHIGENGYMDFEPQKVKRRNQGLSSMQEIASKLTIEDVISNLKKTIPTEEKCCICKATPEESLELTQALSTAEPAMPVVDLAHFITISSETPGGPVSAVFCIPSERSSKNSVQWHVLRPKATSPAEIKVIYAMRFFLNLQSNESVKDIWPLLREQRNTLRQRLPSQDMRNEKKHIRHDHVVTDYQQRGNNANLSSDIAESSTKRRQRWRRLNAMTQVTGNVGDSDTRLLMDTQRANRLAFGRAESVQVVMSCLSRGMGFVFAQRINDGPVMAGTQAKVRALATNLNKLQPNIGGNTANIDLSVQNASDIAVLSAMSAATPSSAPASQLSPVTAAEFGTNPSSVTELLENTTQESIAQANNQIPLIEVTTSARIDAAVEAAMANAVGAVEVQNMESIGNALVEEITRIETGMPTPISALPPSTSLNLPATAAAMSSIADPSGSIETPISAIQSAMGTSPSTQIDSHVLTQSGSVMDMADAVAETAAFVKAMEKTDNSSNHLLNGIASAVDLQLDTFSMEPNGINGHVERGEQASIKTPEGIKVLPCENRGTFDTPASALKAPRENGGMQQDHNIPQGLNLEKQPSSSDEVIGTTVDIAAMLDVDVTAQADGVPELMAPGKLSPLNSKMMDSTAFLGKALSVQDLDSLGKELHEAMANGFNGQEKSDSLPGHSNTDIDDVATTDQMENWVNVDSSVRMNGIETDKATPVENGGA